MMGRCIATLVVLLAVWWLPWWAAAAAVLGGIVVFREYVEGIAAAVLLDLGAFTDGFAWTYTAIAVMAFAITWGVRARMRT